MKTTTKAIIAALMVGAATLATRAQDANGNNQNGPGFGRHRPPPSPIVQALDANHDGVIDANEIANASAALKTLDKNGDGKLTRDEYCPHPPKGGNGQNRPDDAPNGPPEQ